VVFRFTSIVLKRLKLALFSMQSTQNKFNTVTLLRKLIYYSYFAICKNRHSCFIKCHWSNAQIDQMHLTTTLGHFTFWINLSLRPKTETKRLNFEVIFAHQNLISNRLTYLVHAKSTGKWVPWVIIYNIAATSKSDICSRRYLA